MNGSPHAALDLTVGYAHSDGVGAYATRLDTVRSSFPSLISRHRSVDVRLRYAWRTRSTVVLRYYFERNLAAWEEQRRDRTIVHLQRQAKRFDLALVPATAA